MCNDNKLEKGIYPLSGRGEKIIYRFLGSVTEITWGKLHFEISNRLYEQILNGFLVDDSKWYALGVSMTEPIIGGLGEFISNEDGLTPRHGSAIAAIMYNEAMIDFRGKKPIEIRKKNKS